ncbi:LysR family transcriptional regulator [Massilia sp. X63]|uniref:LysR substrate-binding domain-containing protein n=1 Tax=Massilia sp. X63 TaxID=3237285 RepID=UPI0034DCE3E6
MNTKQLEHFLAVADTRSVSRAAERLFITQSALSRSIQALEQDLGARLFDRIGKRIELTPLGAQLLARAARLVRDVEELQRSVDIFRQGEGGALRIGLGSGAAAMLTVPLLRQMGERHPQVRVAITRGPLDLQLMQLRAGQLDALVADARGVTPAPDLVAEPIGELRTCFACRPAHPLAAGGSVTLAQVLAWPVASTPLSSEVARLLVTLYGQDAMPERMLTLQSEDMASLVEAVAQSDAIFLGLAAAARAGGLAELVLDPPLEAGARFACVSLAGRTEAPLMAEFRRFARARLNE